MDDNVSLICGGRAEIENTVWYDFHIFNFSTATRDHFSNVSTLFTSMNLLSKKGAFRFFKDRILIEISIKYTREVYFGPYAILWPLPRFRPPAAIVNSRLHSAQKYQL